MTIANDVAVELSNRLKSIKVADGFQTDIGLTSFRGRRRLSEEQMPCSVLVERPDEVDNQSTNKAKIKHRYVLEGHMACDPDNPNDTGHKIIGDIKRAVFSGNVNLAGRLTANNLKTLSLDYAGSSIAPREDGLSIVSASVEVAVSYVEELSNP